VSTGLKNNNIKLILESYSDGYSKDKGEETGQEKEDQMQEVLRSSSPPLP
jgi:hypothetical protein